MFASICVLRMNVVVAFSTRPCAARNECTYLTQLDGFLTQLDGVKVEEYETDCSRLIESGRCAKVMKLKNH